MKQKKSKKKRNIYWLFIEYIYIYICQLIVAHLQFRHQTPPSFNISRHIVQIYLYGTAQYSFFCSGSLLHTFISSFERKDTYWLWLGFCCVVFACCASTKMMSIKGEMRRSRKSIKVKNKHRNSFRKIKGE